MGKLHQITMPFDSGNVEKWIRRLEIKMTTDGVTSQWYKQVVLEANHRSTHYSNLGVVLMMRRNKCELLLLCYTFSRVFYNVTFVVISPKVTE